MGAGVIDGERSAAPERLRRVERAYRTLVEANRALARASDERELLMSFCRVAVRLAGYRFAWVGVPRQDVEQSIEPVAEWGFEDGYLASLRVSWADDAWGHGPTGEAIRTHETSVVQLIDSDPRYEPWRGDAVARGYAASAAVPLLDGTRCLGALNLYAEEPDSFGADELELLEEVARDLALGMTRFRERAAMRELEDVAKDRDRLEEELRHAQRMDAVGRLAGGVAHDFNNLLTVILQYAGLVMEQLPPDSPVRGDVAEIERAGKRAAILTRQLLAFSRKSPVAPVVLDPDALVLELQKMLSRILGEHIELSTELGAAPWRVKADRGHFEQVLVNLIVNARDAMPRGGHVRVGTKRVTFAAAPAWPTGLRAGDWVVLTVSDDGEGMSPDVRDHAFEPFFTTKSRGTGLGLATVYGIVRQAGGEIVVDSAVGAGSTFTVYLPRTLDATSDVLTPLRPLAALRRALTILLVEDEDAVRAIARRSLEQDGHRVVEATTGAEALELFDETPFDLVVTDVVMPGLGGPALVERLRERTPGMPVLFLSGHAAEMQDEHGLVPEREVLLSKPFTREALGIAVQEALARDRSKHA